MAFVGFGSDLRLLKNVAQQDDRHRGSDLSTARRPETGMEDLETITGKENLEQALLLRFVTHVGELAVLGHPDYGSQLYTLIGELNNDANRNLAKLYTLEALAAEPRVQEVVSVDVTQDATFLDQVNIQVSLIPINSDTPLNLVFSFSFQGGLSQ
jgi:phage baseplate assembly protein W